MRTESLKMKPLISMLVLCMAIFWVVPAFAQNSRGADVGQMQLSESPIARLITEAKGADAPEGSQIYAERLAEMFIGDRAEKAYVTAFSRKLATADLATRRGQRKWIHESAIAQAFNDLMEQVSGASGEPLQTDANVVHQIRLALAEITPALTTVKRHSSECLPSEAVFLMNQLLLRNGYLVDRCPPQPGPNGGLVQHACAEIDSPGFANSLVSRYSHSHSRSENKMLFDHVAQRFGM